MEVENDTNDPVDYDQSGSGGDDEEGRCKGMLTPRGTPGNRRAFPPCGKPDWSVKFTSVSSGRSCTVGGISNPQAKVIIRRFASCDISVEENHP